jgi:hypothetical protein
MFDTSSFKEEEFASEGRVTESGDSSCCFASTKSSSKESEEDGDDPMTLFASEEGWSTAPRRDVGAANA